MAKKEKKTFEGDDGRVVAKMNVDGMPWYMRAERKKVSEENDLSDLTKSETRAIIWGSLKAALLIGGIFVAAFALFILFCVFVWFR